MDFKEKVKDFSKQNNISENQVLNLLNLCEQNFDLSIFIGKIYFSYLQ